MTKKILLSLVLVALVAALPACNSSDNPEYSYETSSSVLVSAFSLSENKKVLDSLQNVFFTIDLQQGRIFNADSLPFGTNVSRLVPKVTAVSTASAVSLEFPREGMSDSIVNYLTNSTDSIDFSRGPVKLRVVSQSGLVERVYQVNVNVHTVKPDTLAWSRMERAPLPTGFDVVDAQRTVLMGDTYYCLTASGDSYCLATTANPADPQWTLRDVAFAFVPQVESLRAAGSAVYMLDADGMLYASSDFDSWTATGQKWHYIYGPYGDELLGSKHDGSNWTIASYPSGKSWEMPQDFPVSGASEPVTYVSNMSYSPQLVMVGGRRADGQLSKKAWGFDGTIWADITNRDLPKALEYLSVVPYDLFDVPSTTWTPERYPALIAMGGRDDSGINRTLFYSTDWGMTWREAPQLMQLPSEMPSICDAQAMLYSTTMHIARSQQEWHPIALRSLPPQCRFVEPAGQSRVTAPITEWECPAIYLYGGRLDSGQVSPYVWRGLILRYTFAPKY